jgi:hypothetical protein
MDVSIDEVEPGGLKMLNKAWPLWLVIDFMLF